MDKNKDFEAWCAEAAAQIRYKPDRKAVEAELMAHLEDAREAHIQSGDSPADARKKALASMGRAGDIAPQLAKLHKPWLGYLGTLAKLCAICALAFSLFRWSVSGISFAHNWISAKHFDSLPANYGELDHYAHPLVHDSTDGVYFEVAEAGYRKLDKEFYFLLDIIYLKEPDLNILAHIWAIDSNGNYYASRAEARYRDIPKVTSSGRSGSGLITHYSMKILDFDCAAQWVELHYDRDGRDVVLRIDLSGGEEG